ncbi:metal ABC transporter ATP-binding protein [Palleronia caenipelagi]|uniref:Metal ABC transporter ATP-binding protein n=1 Tax=Palleronia caenipelagi TaxID=2489174 RepID=A0A547PXS9_9RHOB|nr:metal ABC transporter ATP-binding protein [Palleronia caenipelagi]TRD18960.1 metal ABC transporter ATP-binding protein [Palleronia caenipelagi]
MNLLTLSDVTVRAGGSLILDRISLSIDPGEIVTIVGPNGSGKTTLMRTILGAMPVSGGTITTRPGLTIGYVPQKLPLDGSLPLTVARFLALPHRHSPKKIAGALKLAGLPDIGDRQLSALSGGQMQRALLARALLSEPDLLILDEPTTGLDQQGEAGFYRRIEMVRDKRGCAVLMVSHDLHVVMAASDRVICLNGHVCCHGTPASVASAPEYRALFGHGTGGALALYRHDHDHEHHGHSHSHD